MLLFCVFLFVPKKQQVVDADGDGLIAPAELFHFHMALYAILLGMAPSMQSVRQQRRLRFRLRVLVGIM